MKTIIQSIQKLPRSFSNPLARAALPLFFALAFLPSILRLLQPQMPVTNPFAALGCVIAGFWLASSLREIRGKFVLHGSLITTLLWSVNWLMMAGGNCCMTMGRISP